MVMVPLKLVLIVTFALVQLSFTAEAQPKPQQTAPPPPPPTWIASAKSSNLANFHLTLYKWLLTEKYEILSKDNQFASADRILLFLVPRIGRQASDLLIRNCLKPDAKYEETVVQFAICSLVILDEMFQKKALY